MKLNARFINEMVKDKSIVLLGHERNIYGENGGKNPVRENTEFARNKMNTGNIVYPSCKFLILKKKAIVTLATKFNIIFSLN